jgi:drug/metabolite transporter (DMT)-like permease
MLSGVIIPAFLMVISEYTTSKLFAFALSSFTMPQGMEWIWIILMGIAAAYGQIYMTRAYFYAKAGIVSTVSYSVILFATLFGMMLGDVLPTPMVIAGGILIVLSGVILSRQK